MKKLCSTVFFIISCISYFSQDFNIGNSNYVSRCGGTFFDAGATSDYASGEDDQVTICALENYLQVQIDFSQFNLGFGDLLYVYDGLDNTAPQIPGSPFDLNNSPGTIVSTGNCFFFDFINSPGTMGTGWEAEVSCRSANSCFSHFSYESEQQWSNGDFCGSGTSFDYCYTLFEWNGGASPNAFHGLSFEDLPGSAWMPFITPTEIPNSCDGNGEWVFVGNGGVASTGTGDVFGPGFFYEADFGTGLDNQAGNNQGDLCIPTEGLRFCWNLNVGSCDILWNGPSQPVGYQMIPLSDGISGAYNDDTCLSNEYLFFNAQVGCLPHDACWDCPASIQDFGSEIYCGTAGSPSIELSAFDLFGCMYEISVDGSSVQSGYGCYALYNPVIDEINGTQVDVYISNGQCEAYGSYFYQVILPPEIQMTGGGTICDGGTVPIFFDISTPNTFDVNYTVSYSLNGSPAGSVSLTSGNPTATIFVSEAGVYEVTGVTSSIGFTQCSDYIGSPSVTVEALSGPIAMLEGDTTICAGVYADISVDFSGEGPYTGDLLFNGVLLESISETVPGLYVYSFPFFESGMVTLGNFQNFDCPGFPMGNAEITIGNNLDVEITANALDLCHDEQGQFFFDIEGEGPVWSIDYLFNGMPQTPLEANQSSYSYSTNQEGTYTFFAISDMSCSLPLDTSILLTYEDSLKAAFLEDLIICQGSSGFLQLDFTVNGNYELVYSINGNIQPTIFSADNPYLLEVNQEGIYAIESLYVDGDCPGFPQNTANVSVVAPPSASMDSTLTICPDLTGFVELELSGNGPWVLSYEYNSMPGILDTIFTTPANFPVDGEGTYVITGIEDAVCEGTFNGQADVSLFQLPELSIEADEVICSNSLTQLDLTTTGQGPFNIEIELNGMFFGSFNSPDGQFSIPINLAGNYEVVSISDLNCSVIENQSYNLSYFDAPTISATADTTVCINDEVSFSGSAQGGFGGPFNYWWVLEGDTINSDNFSYEFSQEQNFEFLVDDGCGIYYSQDLTVDLFPFPSFEFLSFDDLLCGAQTITADTDIPLNTIGEMCSWTVNGVTYNDCGPLEASILDNGTFDIELIVESVDGCFTQNIVEDAFTIFPITPSDFIYTPSQPTVVNNLVNFYSNSPDAVAHSWLLNNEFEFSNERNSQYKLEGLQGQQWTVCYAIENEFGCPDTSCSELTIKGDLTIWMPNSFTPNSDGVNDGIRPIIIGADPSQYHFKIWNRWGEIVYETKEMEGAWNGSGKDDPDYYADGETFIWQVIAKPTDQPDFEEFKGSLTLVR